MKRILLFTTIIVLIVCMMTGCKAHEAAPLPTAEEVRAIIPQKANLSLQAYPLLEMPAMTIEECLAKIPAEYHTFTYEKEKWAEDTEAMEALKKFYTAEFGDASDVELIYKPADGSREMSLTVFQEENKYSYDLSIGLLKDDGNGGRTYREYLSYDKDGKMQYYHNAETGFLLDTRYSPDEHYIGVLYEDIVYEYTYEFGALDRVYATENSLNDPDAGEMRGFCFTYYPQADAFRNVCYEYYMDAEEEYTNYSAYYTDEGELYRIDYYRSTDFASATYDGNYEIMENEADEYADYSFLDYLKDMYLPSITTD